MLLSLSLSLSLYACACTVCRFVIIIQGAHVHTHTHSFIHTWQVGVAAVQHVLLTQEPSASALVFYNRNHTYMQTCAHILYVCVYVCILTYTHTHVYIRRHTYMHAYMPIRLLVQLRNNYRSHESLLSLPSRLFYEDSLRACADVNDTNSLLEASYVLLDKGADVSAVCVRVFMYIHIHTHTCMHTQLWKSKVRLLMCINILTSYIHVIYVQEDEKPEAAALAPDAAADHADDTFDQGDSEQCQDDYDYDDEEHVHVHEQAQFEGFPLLFFGVEGKDISDEDSPSFYNPTEAMVVGSLITKLLEMTHLGITTDQIGVIAPYRKQVCTTASRPVKTRTASLLFAICFGINQPCMCMCMCLCVYVHVHVMCVRMTYIPNHILAHCRCK
jgi:hypothetical protein